VEEAKMGNSTVVALLAISMLVVDARFGAQTPENSQPITFSRVFSHTTPGLVNPEQIASVAPDYPIEAMRAKASGYVEMDVTVGVDGRPTDAMVVTAPDPAYGLDAAAVLAISGWTFKAGTLDGKPVPVRVRVGMSMKWGR
jgi:TonB family protein